MGIHKTVIDVHNLEVLEEFFKGFDVVDKKKIMMKAFRRAAAPLMDAARARVPIRSGKLLMSLGTKAARGGDNPSCRSYAPKGQSWSLA